VKTNYRTVAVPTWVYESAKAMQIRLRRRGVDALPPELLAAYGHHDESLGLGIVLGLALVALERELEGAPR
jgi:hypothetical protein